MSDAPEKPEETAAPAETVKCAVCRREIPRADAMTEEGEDYVRWYCGFDCFQKRQQSRLPGNR